MSVLLYRDDDGRDVHIENPTDQDMARFWGIIGRRCVPAFVEAYLAESELVKFIKPDA